MSTKLDHFIDFNIACETSEEADRLVNLIEGNERFILDWDLQGVDDDGSPIDGAIISVQLQDLGGVGLFKDALVANNFEV